MRPKLIYTAGPCERVGHDFASKWRNHLSQQLVPRGFVTFNPADAWSLPLGKDDQHDAGVVNLVQMSCDQTLSVCDIVAVCFQGARSTGTDREIELAMLMHKPIVVIQLQDWWLSARSKVGASGSGVFFSNCVRDDSGAAITDYGQSFLRWYKELTGLDRYDRVETVGSIVEVTTWLAAWYGHKEE